MAIVDVNYFSNALMRQVTYKAIIPTDSESTKGLRSSEIKPFKTLYLLHGIMGDYTDWLVRTRISELAQKHNVAVVMPSGENSFYVDQAAGHNYFGEFIGRELVEESRKLFPLSTERKDTFIGGLSMGGYGALRNGLKYHETFGAIVALSSAIIIEDVLTSTEEAEWVFRRRSYYEYVFGDLSKLKGSDKDLEALVTMIKEKKGSIPNIYIACGTEDHLIESNRKYRDFLVAHDVPHTYVEDIGIHDWKFWDKYIEKALEWLVEL
ncbi:MAG: acetylesterase [Clostridiales bacterium]|nr:acetylesterase [Clostridiales bacterium]